MRETANEHISKRTNKKNSDKYCEASSGKFGEENEGNFDRIHSMGSGRRSSLRNTIKKEGIRGRWLELRKIKVERSPSENQGNYLEKESSKCRSSERRINT